ncbi:hypothetical protein B0H19DRAFT_1266508 [Mycena capillaripes]|nr:hypothetical protein B0H19DRAFT_1266508 [Mycena capillaripes]
MPSSATRSCGKLSFLRVWAARLTAIVAGYFRPIAPELPLSTLDLRAPTVVGTPRVPEDATEDEQLVHSPHWPRELELPRFRDQESAHSTVEEIASSKAAECLFPVSPILACPSPSLLMATPPLIQMSPPSIYCPSLFDTEHTAHQDDVTDSLPASTAASIGELAEYIIPISFFGLQSQKTSIPASLSIHPAHCSFHSFNPSHSSGHNYQFDTPPTAKSPKPLVMPMECPVSDELQECYDQADPFSATGESFYSPEIVCASVPFSNLERLDVYRAAPPNTAPVRSHKTFFKAVESASRTKRIRIRETNIYDIMVYNFQPKVEIRRKKRTGKSVRRLLRSKLAPVSLRCSPTTKDCLTFPNEEPRVLVPRHVERNREVLPGHLGSQIRSVPADFCYDWPPSILWDSQTVVSIPPNAAICAQVAPTRQFAEAVATDAARAAIIPHRVVVLDLLPSLDIGLVEFETNVQPISSDDIVAG